MGRYLAISYTTLLICCAVLLSGEGLSPRTQLFADNEGVAEISVDEAAEGIVEGRFEIILDVRTSEEYEKVHILGALNIPLDALKEKAKLKLSDPAAPIITYCRSGRRSAEAARLLKELGYINVVSIKGGIIAWKEKGYPVVEE